MGEVAKLIELPAGSLFAVIALYVILVPQGRDNILFWVGVAGSWCRSGRRLRVRSDVQRSLETAGASLNRVVPHSVSRPMRIEWVRGNETREAFLEKGQVVIRLRDEGARHRNLAMAILLYLQEGVAQRGKRYLRSELSRAIDIRLAKTVLHEQREEGALGFLQDQVIEPEVAAHPGLAPCCTVMDRLEDAAYLRPVLLPEVQALGDRVYPATPSNDIAVELNEFVGFLQDLALRATGDTSPDLVFKDDNIRCQVVLVADAEKYSARGVGPYLGRVEQAYREGTPTVYFCARGSHLSILDEIRTQCLRNSVYVASAEKHIQAATPGKRRRAAAGVIAVHLHQQ